MIYYFIMNMWAFILIGISFILSFSYALGRRQNSEIKERICTALEKHITPVKPTYLEMKGGIGRRFEFLLPEDSGPIRAVRGMLTLLPRHAPLYMPFSRFIGRTDLLTITWELFSIVHGIGYVIGDRARRDGWYFIENEEEMRLSVVEVDTEFLVDTVPSALPSIRSFHVYAYNPLIVERLSAIVPILDQIPGFRQLNCRHREKTVSVILEAPSEQTEAILERLDEIIVGTFVSV